MLRRPTLQAEMTAPQAKLLKLFTRYCRYGRISFQILFSKGPVALIKTIRSETRLARYFPIFEKPKYTFAKKVKSLSFPVVEKPTVSIIIPVYNKYLFTFNCLRAVLEQTSTASYEVVVVDDCSTDKTQWLLLQMEGLRVIRNSKNLGFLRSCNGGADAAVGEYLVFLNNDAIVTKLWLDRLLQTFKTFPETGLVGAKLVYPNGRLQEAGGIIWKDGTGCNYGKFDDPHRPEYNYLREVDYCSGACLMVPAKLFRTVRGFDSRYAPAYYEDTDLAFQVRDLGYKVFYQPHSQVIHFEGVSSGTSVKAGVKRYQEINRHQFVEKWKKVLDSHQSPRKRLDRAKERSVQKSILVIDACTPTPDHDSGSLRMYNLLVILRTLSYKVTFVPDNLRLVHPYVDNLQASGVEVLYGPYVRSVEHHLRERGPEYDVVVLSRIDVAQKHLDLVRGYAPQASVVFDTVDLHFVREFREAELRDNPLLMQKARIRKNQELEVAKEADITLVVSPEEKAVLERECDRLRVHVVPNIHENRSSPRPFGERQHILFMGGFNHPPNVDAVHFFVREIFPRVKKTLTHAKLYIVGSAPPSSIQKLARDDILVTGYVADPTRYFESMKLSVAPIRYGAGLKGKVTMSLSFGVPVVATPIAAEGTHLVHSVSALIVDTPAEFAEAVESLYSNEDLWNRLSTNGRDIVAKYFSVEAVTKDVEEIFGQLQPVRTLLHQPTEVSAGLEPV